MPQILAVGVIAGIFLCLLLTVVVISRRRYIEDPARFDSWLGLSVIASIPHTESPGALLAYDAPDDLALQGVRSLGTAIDLMTLQEPTYTVAVTGIADDVGAGFVSLNLAGALSAAGQRVLLVDAGMESGSLHEQLAVEAAPGLSDMLAAGPDITQAVHKAIRPGLSFVARGGASRGSLIQQHVAAMIRQWRDTFDCVIVATPPASVPADAAVIARECTLAVLIARSGRHTQATLDEAIRGMERERVKATGLVFNDQSMPATDYEAITA